MGFHQVRGVQTTQLLKSELLRRFYARNDGTIDKKHRNKHKINYVRFADDFVITADTAETAQEVLEVVKTFLEPRGLTLSEEKTLVTDISEGYPGFPVTHNESNNLPDYHPSNPNPSSNQSDRLITRYMLTHNDDNSICQ